MNNKPFLFTTIFLFLTCLQSCKATEECESDIIIDHSICTNTHMGYQFYDYDYRKEMCKSIGEMNLGMIRDYIYNNATNSAKDRIPIFNNILYNLHKYAPNTQVLGILHDRNWDVDINVPLSNYHELVRTAVKTYNGRTRFIPTDYGKEMSYEIKYWEICNELDWYSYGRPPFEFAGKVFDLVKSTYKVIKEANPNAFVVFPGIAHLDSKFVTDVFDYEDDEGKRIWDYFDVFNFHHYPKNAEDLVGVFKKVHALKEKYGWDKPVWLTEVGWSEFHSDENEIAMNLPKAYLLAYAYGIDKVFMFQHRSFDYNCSVDAHFGLIRSSLDATYISLSSGGKPFSNGQGLNHVLINANHLNVPFIYQRNIKLAKLLLDKLKKDGLEISGNDFVVDKVTRKHLGDNGVKDEIEVFFQNRGNTIIIPSTSFVNYNINDEVVIHFKEYKREIKWKKTERTKSFFSIRELMKRLPDESSNFSVTVNDDIYMCKWLNNKKQPIMAIWGIGAKKIALNLLKNHKQNDYMEDSLGIISKRININKNISYLIGHYQILNN